MMMTHARRVETPFWILIQSFQERLLPVQRQDLSKIATRVFRTEGAGGGSQGSDERRGVVRGGDARGGCWKGCGRL